MNVLKLSIIISLMYISPEYKLLKRQQSFDVIH